jgi:putative transcriptional regulator
MKERKSRKPAKGGGRGKRARPSVESRIITGLREAVEVLERGGRLEDHFTVRHVRVDLSPPKFRPVDVRAVRQQLGVSQAVFARLLAVSNKTIQAWEQGAHPTPMACRLLDVIRRDPSPWLAMLTVPAGRRTA